MKNRRIMKIAAFAAALCMSISMLSGCSDKNNGTDTSANSGNAVSSETTASSDGASQDVATETLPEMHAVRPVQEGDVPAINKFVVDPLPANYELVQESAEYQGRLYLNGVSKITVMACNYKEDFQELEVAAESACASLKMNNMLFQSDTDFEEPVETTVDGFRAISRDFTITQNEFVKENPDEEGDGVKTPVAWYKSRIVYFYSDKDVFYCIFETAKDDWDSAIVGFEEFIANIKIDENAEVKPAETTASQSVSPEGIESEADAILSEAEELIAQLEKKEASGSAASE